MADLQDFYPVTVQASPRGDGTPASPGVTSGVPSGLAGAVASKGSDPALWLIGFVGLALFLLHKA